MATEVDAEKGTTAAIDCICGVCSAALRVGAQPLALPKSEAQETQETAATTTLLGSSFVLPGIGTSTGLSLAKLSIISRLCPEDGRTQLDSTINPLGLELGDDPDMVEVNGALVGSIAIQGALLLVSLGISYHMYRRLHGKRLMQRNCDTVVDSEKATSRLIHQGLRGTDIVYLMARGRFGWVLIPATFLFGGAAFTSASAILYSSPLYKVIGIMDIIIFQAGIVSYATYVAKQTKHHSEISDIDGDRPAHHRFIWGKREWGVNDGHGHGAWVELNHLLYDGYTHASRYFLTYELLVTFAIGWVGAWSPGGLTACWVKSSILLFLLTAFCLTLLLRRPYLAPYENVAESAIAGGEVVVSALTMGAMGTSQPNEHWAAQYAAYLSLGVTWLVTAKALMDMTVFVIDEYGLWKEIQDGEEKGSKMSFLAHLLCCGNNIPDDRMDDYVMNELPPEEQQSDAPLVTPPSPGGLHASASPSPISSQGNDIELLSPTSQFRRNSDGEVFPGIADAALWGSQSQSQFLVNNAVPMPPMRGAESPVGLGTSISALGASTSGIAVATRRPYGRGGNVAPLLRRPSSVYSQSSAASLSPRGWSRRGSLASTAPPIRRNASAAGSDPNESVEV